MPHKNLKPLSQYITELKKLYPNNQYDYSLIDKNTYKNSQSRVNIKCNIHDYYFEITLANHKNGQQCKFCALENRAKLRTKTITDFIKRAKEKHGDRYDYSKSTYLKCDEPICIICTKHGEFWQLPEVHYRSGCNECGNELTSIKNSLNNEDFINKSILLHGFGKFDYSKVIYKNSNTHVNMICTKCKLEFPVTPSNHLSKLKKGCPHCNSNYSSGNKIIFNFLKMMNIKFKDEFRIKECKYKRVLPFDFAIFDEFQNIKCLIEFDGKYHFKPEKETSRHNIEKYQLIKIRDSIKTKFCIDNKIKLLRISYLERDNIESILRKELNLSF